MMLSEKPDWYEQTTINVVVYDTARAPIRYVYYSSSFSIAGIPVDHVNGQKKADVSNDSEMGERGAVGTLPHAGLYRSI